MEGCFDDLMELMLHIRDGSKQSALVVIIDHRNHPFPFSFDVGHPPVIGNIRAYGIPNAFRPGGIPPGINNFIEPVEQIFRERYSNTGEIIIKSHKIRYVNIIAACFLRF
jgi:hypothetical protein